MSGKRTADQSLINATESNAVLVVVSYPPSSVESCVRLDRNPGVIMEPFAGVQI